MVLTPQLSFSQQTHLHLNSIHTKNNFHHVIAIFEWIPLHVELIHMVRRLTTTWLSLYNFYSVWCSLHCHHFHCKHVCLWRCYTAYGIHPRSSFSLQAHLPLNRIQTVRRLTITRLSLHDCNSIKRSSTAIISTANAIT